MNIYLDIETIPCQKKEFIHQVNKDDAKSEEKYRKTALDGSFGEVFCISYAIDDMSTITISPVGIKTYSEEFLLESFFENISEEVMRFNNRRHTSIMSDPHKFIGHNVQFDLRFLYQRSIINGIKPSIALHQDSKPWDGKTIDTMAMWCGYGNKISLDNLCKALGIEGKGDLDGSKVWDYVKEGRYAEVAEYCAADVERVRQVYKRMIFL